MTTRLSVAQDSQLQAPKKGLARWQFIFNRFIEDGHIYKRFWSYIKPYWFRTLIAILLTIPAGSLDAAVAFSLKPYMDGILTKDSIVSVGYVPLIIIGFTIVQGLFTYFAAYLNGWLGYRIGRRLRQQTLEKMQQLEPAFYEVNDMGVIVQRAYMDTFVLQDSALQNIRQFLTRLFSSLFLSAVLIGTSWKLAIIAIGILATIIYPSTKIRRILKEVTNKMVVISSRFFTFYAEEVRTIKVIYAFSLLKKRFDDYTACEKDFGDAQMKILKASSWMAPSMHFISSIGIAVILWQGTQMVVSNEITVGAFVSFLTALLLLYNPVKNLGNTLMQVQTAFMAAERLFEFLDITPDILDKPNAITLNSFNDTISFEEVSFSYVPEQPVLKNFNLTIHKNETVALVGTSGGGKSTLASLLPRFYDVVSGSINIDGHDIRDIKLESLREKVSIVMQDSCLFMGSIRENMLMGKPDASDEEIAEVLRKVHLKDFVETLDKGIHTNVGDAGNQLSGGQKQRLSIARALLKDAPIFVLDEATSALDSRSEEIIQNAVEDLMKTKTVIIIAHRLSTIRQADKVLVLSEGRIVEEGTHEELLSRDEGTYKLLYQTQYANTH